MIERTQLNPVFYRAECHMDVSIYKTWQHSPSFQIYGYSIRAFQFHNLLLFAYSYDPVLDDSDRLNNRVIFLKSVDSAVVKN